MDFLQLYLIVGSAILVLMTLLWCVSLLLKNSSIVDIFWGTGFVISAWVAFALTPAGFLPRKLLLCAIVTLWGLRLTLYILSRNFGKPEDFRYQAWRERAGAGWWWRSLQGFPTPRRPHVDYQRSATCSANQRNAESTHLA